MKCLNLCEVCKPYNVILHTFQPMPVYQDISSIALLHLAVLVTCSLRQHVLSPCKAYFMTM